MRTPKLKRIRLSKRDGSNHPDIKNSIYYLVKIYGNLYAGTFSKQWYGWSFNNWGVSGIQLNSTGIEDVWQIVNGD